MALVIDDRVRETTTVTGTNDATLLGAVTGFQAFSVIGNGNTTFYTISDQSGGNFEVGIGTFSSVGPTLERTTVLDSSNGGAKVSFPAGTKDVFVTYPAAKAVYLDASNNIQPALGTATITTGVFSAGTAADPAITTTGDTNTGIFFPAADTIAFTEGGVEAMRIDSVGEVSISANNTTNGLRITQTGSGNALLVEDSANPDSTPFVIDASGKVIVGATASQSIGISDSNLQVIGTGPTDPSVSIGRFRNDAGGATLSLFKGRGSIGSFTSVNLSDALGSFLFYGADGTSAVLAAEIRAVVDGTPGTNDMPGRLVFSTTADGDSTPTERMRITNAGNVGIGTTSPATPLHVSGTSSTAIARIASTSNGASTFDGSGAGLEIVAGGMNTTSKYTPAIKFGSTDPEFTTTNPKFMAAITAEAVQAYASDTSGGMTLAFWTSPASPGTGNGLVERMRIDSSGNVLVGTTTPIASATNRGNITINGSVSSILSFGIGGTAKAYLFHDDDSFDVWNVDSSPMVFATADTERMRITSTGAISFGSTGTAYGTSGQVLTSQGNATPIWTTPTVGTVTSVGGTGTVNGLTLTGTVTTSGNLTLGGTLAIAATQITSGTISGERGVTAGSTSTSFVEYNGTTSAAGQFYGGTTTPTNTTRLNYGGYFYPTFINLTGSSETTTAASHYWVETGSDGFVRPKTLANVRTEVVGGYTAPIRLAAGSAAAPAYSFSGQTGSGMSLTNTNQTLSFTIGGGNAIVTSPSNTQIYGLLTVEENDIVVSKPTAGSYTYIQALGGTQTVNLIATDGFCSVGTQSTDNFIIVTDNAERAIFTTNGYLRMASGSLGIQFNGDTAAANALDDYEEGSFTPTIAGATTAGTGTYSRQVGRYTKIGDQVRVNIALIWSAHTGTGTMRILGLPFTTVNIAGTDGVCAILPSNITSPASTIVTGITVQGQTRINLYSTAIATSVSNLLAIDTAGTINLTVIYEV